MVGSGFSGLNRPDIVIVWEHVNPIAQAWEMVKDYLRGATHVETVTDRPKICQASSLGDNFYYLEPKAASEEAPALVGCDTLVANFQSHIKEAFGKLLQNSRVGDQRPLLKS